MDADSDPWKVLPLQNVLEWRTLYAGRTATAATAASTNRMLEWLVRDRSQADQVLHP
jgi:hypothetical protein